MMRILACVLFLLSVAPAFARGADPVVDLEHWDRRALASGLPVRALIGHPVIANGQAIGRAVDMLFDTNSVVRALLVDVGGGQVVAFDWRRVQIAPDARSATIAGPAGPDAIPLPQRVGVTQPRPFFASELLGDRARSDGMRSFGVIRDAIITPDGRLSAVVVQLFHLAQTGGPSGTFPFPFYGYELPFQPASGFYALPYNEDLLFRYAQRYPQLNVEGGPTGF